jgi:ATP-binding cassette subfamily F protein 2
MEPHMLFLDEPTNHLDIETINALIDGINNFTGGVVMISHDMNLITETNSELWICYKKTLRRFDGTYEEYRAIILD